MTSAAQVRLDGSASNDPDGRIVTYSWAQESGPAVALEQATLSVATFQAPVVQGSVALNFRLVVTDDRGASATAQVTITVIPGVIGLHDRGLQLLKESLRPEVLAVECGGCPTYLGIWLGARVQAVRAERDPELDRLLDELRVILFGTAATTGVTTAGADDAAPILELGLRSVAAFTEQRDPATASLARRNSGDLGEVAPEEWASAIRLALPGLAGEEATFWELQDESARLLAGELDGVAPAAIAAATLLLTLEFQVATPAAVRVYHTNDPVH